MRNILDGTALTQGAWLKLDVPPGSLTGDVVYCRELLDDWVRIDLHSRPAHGEMPVMGIRNGDDGWTGVAMVNTSGVANEILYRGYDNRGNIVDEGLFVLAPGEKWLNTVHGFSPSIPNNGTLMFFSQYDVNSLVIQHEYQPRATFGMRGLSRFNDRFNETIMTVPENWSESEVICANYQSTNVHVLFEGYDEQGVLHGRFHTILSNALKPFEVRRASVAQIMENGVVNGDLSAIRYFKVSAIDPVYCFELVGERGAGPQTVSHLIPLYENP